MEIYDLKMRSIVIPKVTSSIENFNYYMVDLRNYYFSNSDQIDSKIYKEHFKEIFEVIRNWKKFMPYSREEIELKRIHFGSHNRDVVGKDVLILDMDETLIHSQFMVDKSDDTFELEVEAGKRFHVLKFTQKLQLVQRPTMPHVLA